ncbi:glial cell line-derived neurotrophic factor-like [Synchiropus splendidus]|uniref:glial cell line-derived neurotrophic factor-like n=1 Tax=Synchiropus splendidus TaxID=270530 RepID=UPI00237D4E47|nr:glial cell line-derived neurotrophic factor-like [Synchiropus splendidus]
MTLWDSLAICLTLLCTVHSGPLLTERRERAEDAPLQRPSVHVRLSLSSRGTSSAGSDSDGWEDRLIEETLRQHLSDEAGNVLDFIKVTIRRSSKSSLTSSSTSELSKRVRLRRERRKKGRSRQSGDATGRRRGGGGGRGQGCGLRQLHLNVSDLGLGYRSDEEMIFKYCSGPCRKSETNYDKILYSLLQEKRFPHRDSPPQACCRPVAFDDDLSFLDDNLVYHTVRKHSARKCGCV